MSATADEVVRGFFGDGLCSRADAEARYLTADKEAFYFKRFHGALALARMP